MIDFLDPKSSYVFDRLWSSPKALLLAKAKKALGKTLLILSTAGSEESDLHFDLQYFSKEEPLHFLAWETLPGEGIAPSPDVVGERYQTLRKIQEAKEPLFILSSLQAALQKVIPQETFSKLYLKLTVGDSLTFSTLTEKLSSMGYQRSSICADKGEFAIRGGLIDLYPVSSPDPFRIEFFGDEIESIRTFDPISQISLAKVAEISVTPAVEDTFINQEKNLKTLLDYLGKETIVVLDDPVTLEDRWVKLKEQLQNSTPSFSSFPELIKQIDPLQKIYLFNEPLHEVAQYQKGAIEIFGETVKAKWIQHPFERISNYLVPENETPSKEELFCAIPEEMDTLFLYSNDRELEVLKIDQKNIRYERGYLSSGLVDTQELKILFPYTELTHKSKIRRQKQRSTYHFTPSSYEELEVGDLVVHLHNGVGRYLGMQKKPNFLGIETEFIEIEYAENGRLFVPLSQSYLITRYIGAGFNTSDTLPPKLHTIGSSKWRLTKEKTERQIMGYATDLLQTHAQREVVGGFAYPEDSEETKSFEEEFPYVETEDQLLAISALKNDMQNPTAMDRLICGDVGYGKTEVAMRAAFKAVVDGGKQVAMLVPTTILALQHYENFSERMANFPVRVAHLSRFLKPKEKQLVVEAIQRGTIDIVIGTHRLISQDVIFKNLGLVIIDEEQRFGVKAKEHLKKVKAGVDCLTLSATPIPRTLYMSIIGVRDVSTIYTPPQDRLPIKSVIVEPSDSLIQTALLRELNRGGQTYIIHNRIETIFDLAAKIKKLVPQARIVVGHGQMSSDEIDEVFHTFKQGKADILIATTIVESGIDIPNANTILIDQADKFGIADLYQLRGRVGRWNRRAFCYFLVRNIGKLPEISRKRLEAMAASSGHGGGMKVAMRDLEIRGAGDLLGVEQSGHVSSIGFQLYCKLLQRTIKALKGDMPKNFTECQVVLNVDARLPDSYVNDVSLRMEFYRRLGEALSLKEAEEIYKELQDRFGKPPNPAEWLYITTRLRIIGSMHKCTLIKIDRFSLLLERKRGEKKEQTKHLLGSFKNGAALEEAILKIVRS